MLITKKLNDAINTQIGREMEASNQYLQIAAYFESRYLKKLADLFYKQAAEEQEHALKFAKYLQDQGEKVVLGAMEAPKTEWKGILEMFQDALLHEKKVTAWINDLNSLAIAEKDYATQSMLRWFIDEQVEEEANCNEAISALSLNAASATATYMVDRQIGKRGAS